jgi:hypothetical protein
MWLKVAMALGVEGQSTRFVALRLIVEFRYGALGYERPDRLAGSKHLWLRPQGRNVSAYAAGLSCPRGSVVSHPYGHYYQLYCSTQLSRVATLMPYLACALYLGKWLKCLIVNKRFGGASMGRSATPRRLSTVCVRNLSVRSSTVPEPFCIY